MKCRLDIFWTASGQEEQGGEQHRSLEQLSVALNIRRKSSWCEDVEGECNKGFQHTNTTEPTHCCVGADREGEDDKYGQRDQSEDPEEGRHEGEGGSSEDGMGDKEGHCFEHCQQFGRDLDLVIIM